MRPNTRPRPCTPSSPACAVGRQVLGPPGGNGTHFPRVYPCVRAEIVSFLVHNGHGCFAASLLPASALQAFLGYNETRGIKFARKQLFTDFWMTVAQASQEVERLLSLARRHAEVAVSGLHSAGLRDEAAVMVWMRKYGRNEGERSRLQEMLDRMGVGVGE